MTREPGSPRPETTRAGGRLPLTPSQHALWLDVRLQPPAVYHEACAWETTGALDTERLSEALAAVAARHQLLCARLLEADGRPAWVTDRAPGAGVLECLEDAPRARRDDDVAEFVARPFELGAGPLWRCLWRQEREGDGVLVLVLHHLIVDAAGFSVLQAELSAAYSGQALAARPFDFGDVAEREQRRLVSERGALTRFWAEHLAGADLTTDWPPPLEPCPPGEETSGATSSRVLRPTLAKQVRARAAEWGTTPFIVYMAAWLSTLRVHAGRDDLVLGTPATLRDNAAAEGVVGYLLSPVLVRARLRGTDTFREAVAKLADEWRIVRSHARLPLHLVREALPGGATRLGSPVQAFFSLIESPAGHWRLGAAVLRRVRLAAPLVKFQLCLLVEDGSDEARLVLEFQRSALDAGGASRLLAQVEERLAAAVERPDTAVARLPLIPAEETRQLLEWGSALEPTAGEENVIALFRRQVSERPDAIAVVAGPQRVTYAALGRRASAVANALRAAGVGPGDRVVLRLRRGVRFIASALGILQCGAAYVPVDPAEPPGRLRRMLEPLGPRAGVNEGPGADGGLAPVWLDASVADEEVRDHASTVCSGVSRESAAYVMFTSGSTGQPKGVEVPHRGIVRLVQGQAFADMGSDERWLHLAPVTFDAATLEIWAPLLNGGCCVVVQERLPSPGDLQAVIRGEGVTSAWLTASLFNALVDEAPGCLAGLRQVMTGGEALSPAHVGRALRAWPGVRLVNGYGPTENTTFTCCHQVSGADLAPGRSIPIGRPIGRTTVRVVDADGQLSPIGVPGELVTGGDGVALAYVGLPDHTRARFEPDPEAGREGRLRYRTGDRVRWRPEGVLEFLGRFDDQVKIHGHRVEPGEVEACLAEHESVRQAAVVTCASDGGRAELTAYVVPQPGVPSDDALSRALDVHAATRLPPYLRPGRFVFLPALPLTPNGKIDRAALPRPVAVVEPEARPIDDETERAVAEIFAEVLETGRLGPEAHFFRLGGDSLQALCVAARFRERFGVDLSTAALFEEPTVAAQARLVRARWASATVEEEGLSRVARGGRLPLTPAQHALWLDTKLRPAAVYNEAFAWETTGDLDRTLLQTALAAVARRHELLRARLVEEDGEACWVADVDPGRGVLHVVPGVARETRDQDLALAIARPFDLAAGPLWRCVWREEREGGGVLLLVFHHLVVDAASLPVLRADLAAAYAGHALQPPAHDFGDVARWERRRLAVERERLAAFWSEHLAGANLRTALARRAEPCRAGQELLADRVASILEGDVAARVRARAAEWETTPFVLYLAAWLSVLRDLTGSEDLVVGTPVTLRDTGPVQAVVGYLLSPVLLRVRLAGTATFREVCAAVRRAWADVRANARLPLDLVCETLATRSTLSSPVQVFFSSSDTVVPRWSLGVAELQSVETRPGPAKFEVFLLVERGEDEVRLVLEYQPGVLDRATAKSLLADVGQRLARGTLEPGAPLRTGVPATPWPARESPTRAGELAATRHEPATVKEDESINLLSPLARATLEIWRDVLGNERLAPDDDFFEAGGDSLDAVRMMARVSRLLGEDVSTGVLMQAATARGFAARLEAAVPRAAPAGVISIRDGLSARKLFCLPGLGGHAVQFRPLVLQLHTTRSVLAVEAQHLDVPPSTFSSLEQTASAVVRAIRGVQPDGPYALLGYSYGGYLAIEVARCLLMNGQHVNLAGIVGALTPDAIRPSSGLREKLLMHAAILRRLTPGEALDYLARRFLRKLLLWPKDLGEHAVVTYGRRQSRRGTRMIPTEREHTTPFGRAAIRAVKEHRFEPFAGEIVLFHPLQLPDWTELADPTGGWGRICLGGVEAVPLPCAHHDVFEEPGLSALATALNRLLATIDGTREEMTAVMDSESLQAASAS